MSRPLLSPSAAHFESIARSRPADHNSDLLSKLPESVERLLGAGCASGRLTLSIAQRVNFAVGIDLSLELIDLAQTLAREREIKNVEWIVGDMEHLPFQSGSFDVVTSTNAVRLTNVPVTLDQLAGLVKPGGRMVVQDIMAAPHPLRRILFPYLSRTVWSVPRYLRLYGAFMLVRILAYRLRPAELRRAAVVDRLSLDVLEEICHRAAPGCTISTNRWGYLAVWQKPPGAVNRTCKFLNT
jgi:ubiquinone/menaquinone biosynthesis C-methylase UbiE